MIPRICESMKMECGAVRVLPLLMSAFTNLQKLFAIQRYILTLIVSSYQEPITDTLPLQISPHNHYSTRWGHVCYCCSIKLSLCAALFLHGHDSGATFLLCNLLSIWWCSRECVARGVLCSPDYHKFPPQMFKIMLMKYMLMKYM